MHPQNMHAQQQQLINGTWVVGNAEPFTKHDPVAGMLLWQGAAASSSQVGAAVEAARAAFPTWARTPFAERQALVDAEGGLFVATGAIFGAWLGSKTQKYIPEKYLKNMLGPITGMVGILYVANYFWSFPFKI